MAFNERSTPHDPCGRGRGGEMVARAAEDENDIAAEDAEVETDLREMRGIAAGRVVRKLQWTGQMKRLSVHTLVLC